MYWLPIWYHIAQCLIDIGVCFRNHSSKVRKFISRISPRNVCYSVNRMLIKEINTMLKCKGTFHRFNFIEHKQAGPITTMCLFLHCFIKTCRIWFKKATSSHQNQWLQKMQILVKIPISTKWQIRNIISL